MKVLKIREAPESIHQVETSQIKSNIDTLFDVVLQAPSPSNLIIYSLIFRLVHQTHECEWER